MPNKFFITGLPRTRSAWLATYFSTFPIQCSHDGLLGCESVDEYFNQMERPKYLYSGDSGSGIPLIWKKIVERYNNPPIVLIERDVKPIIEFAKKLGDVDCLLPLQEAISEMESAYPVLKVRFEDIDRRLPEIWSHCVGNYAFDYTRADLYREMNIQRDLKRYTDPEVFSKAKKFMEKI